MRLDISEIKENLRGLTSYLISSNNRMVMDLDYLNSVYDKISDYQDKFFKQYEIYPSEALLCQELKIPMYDYMNAFYNCSIVSFSNKRLSYSLLQDHKGSAYLRMNVFDLSAYINEGDSLEKYLLNNIGKKFKNYFQYTTERLVPSITYQIKVFPNGNIGDLKIFPSVVRITKEYDSLDNYRDDPVLKSYVAIYKKISNEEKVPSSIFELDTYFKDFFETQVLKLANLADIPVVLCGKNYPDEKMLMYIQNDLSRVFSKMERP